MDARCALGCSGRRRWGIVCSDCKHRFRTIQKKAMRALQQRHALLPSTRHGTMKVDRSHPDWDLDHAIGVLTDAQPTS